MSKKLSVLFGSETGNSEGLADAISGDAKSKGYEVELTGLGDKSIADFTNMEHAVIIVSTWGDGDPPADSEKFCDELYVTEESTDLSKLKFTVLALGDTNYVDYCGCGRRIDGHLQRLGASQFMARKDLDTDFESHFDNWKKEFFAALEKA